MQTLVPLLQMLGTLQDIDIGGLGFPCCGLTLRAESETSSVSEVARRDTI